LRTPASPSARRAVRAYAGQGGRKRGVQRDAGADPHVPGARGHPRVHVPAPGPRRLPAQHRRVRCGAPRWDTPLPAARPWARRGWQIQCLRATPFRRYCAQQPSQRRPSALSNSNKQATACLAWCRHPHWLPHSERRGAVTRGAGRGVGAHASGRARAGGGAAGGQGHAAVRGHVHAGLRRVLAAGGAQDLGRRTPRLRAVRPTSFACLGGRHRRGAAMTGLCALWGRPVRGR